MSIALLCLSGCATAPSEPPPKIFCPPAPAYSKAFENQVADELVKHADLVATLKELEDYTRLRDQLTACNQGAAAP